MKAPFSTEVGTWLRRAREKLGLSRKVLATAAGLSPSTLRNAETNRHKLSRHASALLFQEIARRDAILAHRAPDSLKDAAPRPSKRTGKRRKPKPPEPPLAHLRFQPAGARVLLQLELDQHGVRKLVRTLRDLLTRSQRFPREDLPGLHLVLVERK